jgi:hypothetical protein
MGEGEGIPSRILIYILTIFLSSLLFVGIAAVLIIVLGLLYYKPA